ncbi:diacylglycerol kinase family protein [Crocinitomix sp.]|nr:diacylglycerol kinase family protein [Crocinitomix sp.]
MKNQIKTFIKSLGNAIKGLYFLFKDERNARIHAIATALVVAASFYYEINGVEWVLVALAIVLVLFAEAVNTAIENMMDYISEEQDSRIGKIKDIAAGAVLIMAVFALIIAYVVFWDKVF